MTTDDASNESVERRQPLRRAFSQACRFIAASAAILATGCSVDSKSQVLEPVAVATEAVSGGATFGIGCQDYYQNHWREGDSYVFDNCDGFNQRFNDIADGRWYYNLTGARAWWQQPSSYTNNVDSVEFFFGETHGGAWNNPARAAWAMWDQNVSAISTKMPLAYSEGFFTYACETMKDDGNIWARWSPMFKAGLRVATGSQDTVNGGYFTDDSGYDFADYMADGETFRDAWKDGLWDLYVSQNVATMASGHTESGCNLRLYGMTAYNRLDWAQLTGSSVVWLCWSFTDE